MAKTPTAAVSDSAPKPPIAAADKKPRGRPRASAAADRAVTRSSTGTAPKRALRDGEVLGLDGEVLSRSRSTGFRNEFEVPAHLVPQGFVAQWVRNSCHGKPDESNVTDHYENGWRPLATPGVLDHYRTGIDRKSVERDGLVLMCRPKPLNDQALAEERRAAVELRQAQAEQFGARKLPTGFDDGNVSGDGRFDARRRIRRTIEGAPPSLLPDRPISTDNDD